jgi:hypothetical protein
VVVERGMDPVVGVKRNRETEDQGDREAKIAKFDHERCGLSDLHEELLLQILVNRPKKDTGKYKFFFKSIPLKFKI